MNIEKLSSLFKHNGFGFTYIDSKEELLPILESMMKKDSTVAVGGSQTLAACNVIDFLRSNYNFFDRYKEGLNKDEMNKIFVDSLSADYFITSANAVIEDGTLFFVDATGNRVSAVVFGPKKVIVVVSNNKLVKDLDEANERVKKIAGPLNAKRLNVATPCVKTGVCMDCSSKERICNQYLHLKKSRKERVHIIFINEDLGY